MPRYHGQAFPSSGYSEGMTLRDYFAGRAMHAGLAAIAGNSAVAGAFIERANQSGKTVGQMIAADAYSLADAMLEERGRV